MPVTMAWFTRTGLITPAKKLIDATRNRRRRADVFLSRNSTEPFAVTGAPPDQPLVKMTADLHSVPAALLHREIKKIARRINGSASKDELDRAWAILYRLQEALALATERAKALAD